MLNKKDFHNIKNDPVAIQEQIDIRVKVIDEMLGSLYPSILYEEIRMLKEIKMLVPVNCMPISFGNPGGCPPDTAGSSTAILAFSGNGLPCTVCFDADGNVIAINVPSNNRPNDGAPSQIMFSNPDDTWTQWGGTVPGPDYNRFCVASITIVPKPMTSVPTQGD